jgi:hypothetical protein
MNVLRQALADYLAVRRALGYRLARAEKLLAQFLDFRLWPRRLNPRMKSQEIKKRLRGEDSGRGATIFSCNRIAGSGGERG